MVWGCSSAGEHFVDIEGVTGSIPVTPTIYKRAKPLKAFTFVGLFFCLSAKPVPRKTR